MLYVYGSYLKMKNSSASKTAVLLFACSPEEESRRKNLWKANSLVKDLSLNTVRQIEKSGLEYFHFTEKEQIGQDFGQKFVHAIEKVFDKGFEFIITLGIDTPLLSARHIIQAAQHAGQGEFTIGPSTDGGFYLMGLSRAQFNPDEFRRLPWQTNKVRMALLHLLKAKGHKVWLLPVLMDLDSKEDIQNFVDRHFYIPISIKKYLDLIFLRVRPAIVRNQQKFFSNFTFLHYNKGSPLKTIEAF